MKRLILTAAMVLLCACGARAQEGPISGTTSNAQGVARPGVNVAVCSTFATTAASVTSNIAVYTFSSSPITAGFVVGATFTVYGFTGGDTYFNGSFTIAATSSTTISVPLTHSNGSAGTNGSVYQTGNSGTSCAPLATIYTDNTGNTTTPNPFTSDGLANYLVFAAPGYYRVQLYGPGVTTLLYSTGIACVPQNTSNCGALLGTPNTWTALQTFSLGITSSGPNTLSGGGTTAGAWTHSGAHTFNAAGTSAIFTNAITTGNVLPGVAATPTIGTAALPYAAVSIGGAANTTTTQSSLATANRGITWPDLAGTPALTTENVLLRQQQIIADQGTICTNGELALSAGWQSTGAATVTAVAGNGQTCSWTITTGTTTAAAPTVTDTLTNALPAATTVCEMNIHGGTHTPAAGEGFTQTALSATAPIFTFIGTPTNTNATYFVTRRCGP